MTKLESLKQLLLKPTQLEYFIRNIQDPDWFDVLQDELGLFSHVPPPSLSEDKKQIYFERWWPAQYLIKVADKIPAKVAGVLKDINTDNHLVVRDCMEAVLRMPTAISKTLVPTIDKWFDAKYKSFLDHEAIELFKKFLVEREYDGAIALFDVLATVVPGRDSRDSFRYEAYSFKEFSAKSLPKLFETKAHAVLNIAEKWLKTAIALEKGESKTDFSVIWRPAIEPHEQNWGHDDVKDILADVVRDALEAICKSSPPQGREIIKRFLKEDYSIFPRLAINALRVTDRNEDLIRDLLNDPDLLYGDNDLKHEFILLAKSKLNVLEPNDRDKFFGRILEGPPRDTYKGATEEIFQKHRLFRIRDTMAALDSILEDKPDLMKRLRELEKELGKAENPDIESPHSSWSGPTSPLDKEAISKMTPDEFLEYIIVKFIPKKDDWGPSPSPEGLSRIFEEVVQDNPESWVKVAQRFFDPEKVCPAYLTGFIRGLEKAIGAKKQFSLDPVLELCESLIATADVEFDKKSGTRTDEFNFGTFAWARGTVGNILESIVRVEKFSLSASQMQKIKNILFRLIQSEPNPSEEEENKYSSDKDFLTYCINCNRGKAMRALMQYALRWARTFRSAKEIEAEKGKGPFPPGPSRMEPDLKNFLTERLQKETSPSVQSTYGYFLPFLFYFDKEWVKEMLKSGWLFPKDKAKEQFWKAHWAGFVSYSRFYVELFELLREDYKLAVQQLDPEKKEKYSRADEHKPRLAEHLMLAYYYYGDQCKPDDLIKEFFKKADENTRAHAIGFLGDIFKADEEAKDIDGKLKKWPLLKSVWEDRESIKDYECTAYIRWLDFIPEPISAVEKLICSIIPCLYRGYQEEKLLEYLDKNVETYTLESIRLLFELLKSKESLINIHFRLDLIRSILERARIKGGEQTISDLIDSAVNRLCEMGYYEFRDLLVKA